MQNDKEENVELDPMSRSWNAETVELLCFGYLRSFSTTISIKDLALIVSYYIAKFNLNFIFNKHYAHCCFCKESGKIICTFNQYFFTGKTSFSTVIFTPFISQLSQGIGKGNMKGNKVTLNIEIQHMDSDHYWYKGGGYQFEAGLICIPRRIMNAKLADANEILDRLKQSFSSIEPPKMKHCRLNHVCSKQNGWYSENDQAIFSSFESIFWSFAHFMDLNTSRSRCGKNNQLSFVRNIAKNFKEKDCLEICVDFNQNCVYANQFDHKMKIKKMLGEDQTNQEFKNGKITLEFDKYEYLFAFACARKGTQSDDSKGFVFQISLT